MVYIDPIKVIAAFLAIMVFLPRVQKALGKKASFMIDIIILLILIFIIFS